MEIREKINFLKLNLKGCYTSGTLPTLNQTRK